MMNDLPKTFNIISYIIRTWRYDFMVKKKKALSLLWSKNRSLPILGMKNGTVISL